jgi:hypothetical protein
MKALQCVYLHDLVDQANMVVFFTQVFVINATLNPKIKYLKILFFFLN